MSKLSPQQSQDCLVQVQVLAGDSLEEIQKEAEVTSKFSRGLYDLTTENSLCRCTLSEEYGGYELLELGILQVQEEFSRGPGGMRIYLHYVVGLDQGTLDDYGDEELKTEYMPKFRDKSVFTCLALTKAAGGTGADLHTIAVRDGDSCILNGEKTLVSHTGYYEFAYAIAVTNLESDGTDRLSAFFIPMDVLGLEIISMPHMMGCRGAKHGDLKLMDCHIDEKHLLGKERQGLETASHSLSISGAYVATSNLGMAQRMLEISSEYATDCITFKRPIIARQAIRMKIANIQVDTHVLHYMVYDFARDYGAEIERPCIGGKTTIHELLSIDTVRSVSGEMLEISSSMGYLEDNPYGPIECMYQDCRAMWLEEGASTAQCITISKNTVKFGGQAKYVI